MINFSIDSIKSQVDIVNLVSRDENLTQEGHDELHGSHLAKHASQGGRCLFVNETKQIFHCFHCGAGGDIFDYVTDRYNCTFPEAIKTICDIYNIPYQEISPEEKAKYEKKRKEEKDVRALIKECFKWYHKSMTDEQRVYLHSRGLTDETIDHEWLGYAPSGNARGKHIWKKHGKEIMPTFEKTGLIFKNNDGTYRDRYQDRYVFPYWHRDQIVFSIGRSIDPDIEEEKKYVKHLTHSEKYPYVSDVAVKHVIWGEDLVRGKKEVIITEGIIDALLAKQIGYDVISPVTVKFSDHDNERLAELTKNAETVYLINDNEKSGAGLEGAKKTARVLTKAGINVKIVTIPRPDHIEKVDLADFIVERGDQAKEAVKRLLREANDLLTFELCQIDPEIDKSEIYEKIEPFIKEAVEVNIDEAAVRDWLEHIVKEYFDLTVREVDNYKSIIPKYIHDRKEREKRERKREYERKLNQLKQEDEAKYLKTIIENARTNPYHRAFQIKKSVSNIVLGDMIEHGTFYRTPTERYYWFNTESKKLVEIGDTIFEHHVNSRYNLNKTEEEYKYLAADLEVQVARRGELSEIYRFAHYDTEKQVLYIDRFDCQMYRLDGSKIDLLPNGADGVLFVSDTLNEPFKLVNIGDQKFIEPIIIDPTNFIIGEDVNLSKEEQQKLFLIWIYTLFFEEIQPTKPIQVFVGPKGSGKTTRQRMIGQWFYGRRFDVQPVNEEDDFIATITHNYFAVFDNVDTYKKWLNDRLSQAATGQRIEKRELYTTNRLVRYFPRCFLSLNSREPKFRRDDVVDRLLLFRVERLEKFKSEAKLLNMIHDNRNELWSELLLDLNQIVAAIKKDTEPFLSEHRMADWAELGWRIAKTQDSGDHFVKLLEKMDREQSEFLLEDHPIFQCIDGLLAGGAKLEDLTSSDLYQKLKKYAEEEDIDFAFIKSSRSLGQHLNNILSNLNEFFEITREKDKYNVWHYTISEKK